MNTIRRDIVILLVLLALLFGIRQLGGIDVTQGIENSFVNQYTLSNRCAGDIVLLNGSQEVERIAAGAQASYNPSATAVMRLQYDDGETGWFPVKVEGSDLEVSGFEIPAESDIFGRNPRLIACP